MKIILNVGFCPPNSRHHLYCGVQPLRGAASHRGQRRSGCHLPARDRGKVSKYSPALSGIISAFHSMCFSHHEFLVFLQNKSQPQCRSEYNVYSTFQSHEPEFDYLKSLEIEEKINKIRWLPQKNAAQFLLSTNGQCIIGASRLQFRCVLFSLRKCDFFTRLIY